MKKLNKKSVKIIAATAMCIFTLFSIFSASVAWFSLATARDTDSPEFPVYKEGLALAAMSIHKSDLVHSSNTNTLFQTEVSGGISINSEGEVTYIEKDVKVDDYSQLHRTQPLLFLFTLNDGTIDSDVEIRAVTETTSPLTGQLTSVNGNHLSSVVQFRSCALTAQQLNDITKTNNYSGEAVSQYDVLNSSLGSYTRFVKLNDSGTAWDETDNFDQEIVLYSGTASTEVKYVLVVMDYYDRALEIISSSNMANPLFDNVNVIGFSCDWIMEI